jgi:hypothetical protein
MNWLMLFLAFMLGGGAGMIIVALCVVSKRADESEFRRPR